MANKALDWLISRIGQPVDFSQFPEFQNRYLISSPDPEAARQFLDEFKVGRLANTRLLTIHAEKNIFTTSQINESGPSISQDVISVRVQRAVELFSIFRS